MSQLTAFSSLYKHMMKELDADVPTPILLHSIQEAAREFCERYDVWEEDLAPIVAVDYQEFYELTHEYSAQVHKLKCVRVNNALQELEAYDLWQEKYLRFRDAYAPRDLDDQLLKCGLGLATLATWNAITNGSVTVHVGLDSDSNASVTGLDFSACSTMDEVAWTIQTGVRQVLESNSFYVAWFDDSSTTGHFLFWVPVSDIDYLTAGASGTDISGATYLNGLTGGTGVSLGGNILARVVFRPDAASESIPDWLFDRWSSAIMWLALWRLHEEEGKPWSNKAKALTCERNYKGMLVKAIDERQRSMKYASSSICSR